MEKFFKLKERNTTVRIEFFAGLTTFMAMAYILMVNADMFAYFGDGYFNAVYIATAISAVVGTILIGLLANLPLAQASGMGLNAFFVFTVCDKLGFSYANALVLVLFDGVLFIVLTLTGLRRMIFEAIPKAVRGAIAAGIGLFIAFLGMQNAGLVVDDPATLVNMHSFNLFGESTTWAEIMPILVTIFAVFIIAILSKRKVKGAVLWGIIGGAILYYVLGLVTITGFYDASVAPKLSTDVFGPFKDFVNLGFGKVFTEGFHFKPYIEANGMGTFIITVATTALAFCMVDMFDTLGTLYGACSVGGLVDKNGNIPKMDRAMLADAIATCSGAVCGTSTVTTFVESSAGVAEGGRTGLSAMFTALFFFIAMFLAPVAAMIPGCATAAALIYVGILMIGGVKDIEWGDPCTAVPAFLTMTLMPFTYNISYGIAFGLISYIIIHAFTGKLKEIKLGTWIIGILFTVMFFFSR